MLLNGREVLDQVAAAGLVDLAEVGRLSMGGGGCDLYLGETASVRWVGWSTNLQSSWGVSAQLKEDLDGWIAEVRDAPAKRLVDVPASASGAIDAAGHCRVDCGWRANASS